jgi:hypothetical protein
MRKITHVAWFTHVLHTFGIIITEREGEETKAYIGCVAGQDEFKDMVNIAHWGAKFPIEAANICIAEKGIKLVTPLEILPNEN